MRQINYKDCHEAYVLGYVGDTAGVDYSDAPSEIVLALHLGSEHAELNQKPMQYGQAFCRMIDHYLLDYAN